MSTDIKLSKFQLTKIIQSGRFIDKTLDNFGKKHYQIDLAVPLAKDILLKLATKEASSLLDKFEGKISRKGAVRAGKVFSLFI